MKNQSIIADVRQWLEQYIVFADDTQSTTIATWTVATHCFMEFSAFGYLAINARTKRAGKTRLGVELLQYIVAMGKAQSAPTAAGILRDITNLKPTLIFDESESMGSEAKNMMHALMNVGYKKGQVVTRAAGKDYTKDYDVYCPKIFILIGDVSDTLRDRSITITLERTLQEPPRDYLYDEVMEESAMLRARISAAVKEKVLTIHENYKTERAKYLVSDRDEEVWRSLLAVAKCFDMDAYTMMRRAAMDMSTMKTAPSINVDLDHEKLMEQVEYSRRLIDDCVTIYNTLAPSDIRKKGIKNTELLAMLLDLDLSPWRKFKGTGLDLSTMTELLKAGGTLTGTQNASQTVLTTTIRRGTKNKGKGQENIRGYKWEQILSASKSKG